MLRFAIAVAAGLLALPCSAAETYRATVVKVIDGDTITVLVADWPKPFRPVNVRVAGIDAPESRKRDAKSAIEQMRGRYATALVRRLLPKGAAITLEPGPHHDKYGRLAMSVTLPDGRDLGTVLLDLDLAVPYSGGRKRFNWCRSGR